MDREFSSESNEASALSASTAAKMSLRDASLVSFVLLGPEGLRAIYYLESSASNNLIEGAGSFVTILNISVY